MIELFEFRVGCGMVVIVVLSGVSLVRSDLDDDFALSVTLCAHAVLHGRLAWGSGGDVARVVGASIPLALFMCVQLIGRRQLTRAPVYPGRAFIVEHNGNRACNSGTCAFGVLAHAQGTLRHPRWAAPSCRRAGARKDGCSD